MYLLYIANLHKTSNLVISKRTFFSDTLDSPAHFEISFV